MGKKSKERPSRDKASNKSLSPGVAVDDKENKTLNACVQMIAEIKREHREFCPEAQDFYPVTRDLFEEKIWNEIQTYWLQQPSCVTKETAWKLLEGLELNSLKSQPIYGEHGHDIEDAQELEILYSMPLQWTEPHLAYTSYKRHYKYWSIRWFDLIPGYNQTLFGSIECQPFFQDPPMHLSTEEYTRLSNKSRRGWQLQTHPSFTDALECFRFGGGSNRT